METHHLIFRTSMPPQKYQGTAFESSYRRNHNKKKEDATEQLLIQQLNKETVTKHLDEGGRLTTGIYVFVEGHHVKGDSLAFVKRSTEKREQEKLDRDQKKSRERHDLKQNYDAILAKGDTPQGWTVSDLNTLCNGSSLRLTPP
jgi:hypothetical protein